MLVYNDMSSDSRVIKQATSLVQAGAAVRVVAVSTRDSRFGPGLYETEHGFEILRIRVVELKHLLPLWGDVVRRALGRAPQNTGSQPSTLETPRTEMVTIGADAPAPSPRDNHAVSRAPAANRAKQLAVDLWQRLDLTVRMGSFWWHASRALRSWGPDLIHANDANTLAPAMRASGRRIPFVYDSHELWTDRTTRPGRWLAPRWERAVEQRGARRASSVLTVSNSIADWIQRTYALDRRPILVRNIPVSAPTAGDRTRGTLRSMAGLSESETVIVHCGSITLRRGIEDAVRSLSHLPEDCHLVLIGPSSESMRIEMVNIARSVGASERLHLLNPVAPELVSTVIADADCSLVLTRATSLSHRYSMPNKLFESVHGRLPIVAVSLPDIASIVDGYGIGTLVDEDADSIGIARAIQRTVGRRADFEDGFDRAAAELRWENDAQRMIDEYARLLERST